jgi:hypothetical protein
MNLKGVVVRFVFNIGSIIKDVQSLKRMQNLNKILIDRQGKKDSSWSAPQMQWPLFSFISGISSQGRQ